MKFQSHKNRARLLLACLAGMSFSTRVAAEDAVDVPVFITLGQSNADGSAMFDAQLDEQMRSWYTSSSNPGRMKMWYRSSQIQNQTSNALGEVARWTVDGSVTDVAPGWLDLWYRNENTAGRTAMNMIHNYGTYSEGTGTDCAQGRRGMEGAFGKAFATAMPESELYMLKLGASGSFISSWANPLDDTNWNYFYEKIFKPAMLDLLDKGKRPRLAGVWWMQGCADRDRSQAYYEEALTRLINRIYDELGFANAPIYIGHIIKPGESAVTPSGSVQYGQGVRDAQDAVAEAFESVEIVDTKDYPLQYESSFAGYLHFNHAGVNAIGEELAGRVVEAGEEGWPVFSTPGIWSYEDGNVVFTPAFGNPSVDYETDGNVITATIHYAGFDDVKSVEIDEVVPGEMSPGYLDCDGTRYMRIPNHDDFTVNAGESITVTFRMNVPAWASSGSYYGLVCNNFRNSAGVRSGFDLFMGSSSAQTLANNLVPNSGSTTQATNFGGAYITSGYTPGEWANVAWTYNGSTGESKIYINGEVKRETTGTQLSYPLTSFADILVGARWLLNNDPTTTITNILNGQIDDLRFYSKALSAQEVKDDMESEVDESTEGLIAAYDFSNISGADVPDVSGNGHNGVLVGFPNYAVQTYTLTIETPAAAQGTLKVFDGDEEVSSGSKVTKGTVLRVEAEAQSPYVLETISVNGEALEEGVSSFTIEGNTTVGAVFVRDPSIPVSYTTPSGDGLSDSNCYVESATTSGALHDVSISRSGKLGRDWELCEDDEIEVMPGQTFSLHLRAKDTNGSASVQPSPQDLRYCVAYIFTDWDADGVFEQQMPTDGVFDSFGHYGYFADESSAWEGNIVANYNNVLDITHSFTVPMDAVKGGSRIRVIFTEAWDSTARNGGMNGNYQNINKGYAYDYVTRCVDSQAAINIVTANGLEGEPEYYTIQGVRVSSDQLVPGLYIVRRGAKAEKMFVR